MKTKTKHNDFDRSVRAQIRKEGRKITTVGLVWCFLVGVLQWVGINDAVLAFMHRIPVLGLLFWIPAFAVIIGGPYFLIVGIYQLIFGTRTRTAKKIFGTLQLDEKTSVCISDRVVEGVAESERLSDEVCSFCGSSNLSEPAQKYASLTGAIECDSCGAIWSPPRSRTYAWIIIVCCAIAIPCAIGFLLILYLDEDKVLPLISFLGFSLVAIFMFGVPIYLNTQVLRGKRGKFEVHRPSLRK